MINLLKRWYIRWHDRHDPCARVTGYSRKFVQGRHDEAKAADAARRADHAAKVVRQAQADRALPQVTWKREKVTPLRKTGPR